jgi:Uma2 family endonuclease
MATAPRRSTIRAIGYPTGDGKPMAETEIHRDDLIDLIQTPEDYFAGEPRVCVSGNILLYSEEGNRRKHVSPDVFVVRGVEKRRRENYLVWEEGSGPDLVIEITSKTTRSEDNQRKRAIYRDILKVAEYFQFDPTEDYLKPPLQGFHLAAGEYQPIAAVEGRLPSQILGLHLERSGHELRLYDPRTRTWLPTRRERAEAEHQRAEAEHQRAEAEAEARHRAEAQHDRAQSQRDGAERARLEVEAENQRLRREIESLRGQPLDG